ncbi:hypothetical protein VHTUMSATKI_01550 [Vibrio harveyi]
MPLIICSGVTRKNRLEQGKDCCKLVALTSKSLTKLLAILASKNEQIIDGISILCSKTSTLLSLC